MEQSNNQSNIELINQIDILNEFIKVFHEKKVELKNEFVRIFESSDLSFSDKCNIYASKYGVVQELLCKSIELFVVAKHKLLDS